jgi:hypothetical protein
MLDDVIMSLVHLENQKVLAKQRVSRNRIGRIFSTMGERMISMRLL